MGQFSESELQALCQQLRALAGVPAETPEQRRLLQKLSEIPRHLSATMSLRHFLQSDDPH